MRQAILTGSILNSLSGATSGGEAEAVLSLFEVTKSLLDPPSLPPSPQRQSSYLGQLAI